MWHFLHQANALFRLVGPCQFCLPLLPEMANQGERFLCGPGSTILRQGQ